MRGKKDKMRIVLINPPVDFNKSLGRIKKIAAQTKMIPLGIAYIAGSVRNAGHDAVIVDSYAEGLDITETVRRIVQANPDIVGISCVTPTVPIVFEIARRAKDALSGKPLMVAGGAHPSIFPEDVLRDSVFDVVVRKEGEGTMVALADALKTGRGPESVEGISYKDGPAIRHNPDRAYIADLDAIPFPAYDLLKMELYSAPPHWLVAKPAYQMIASRGCPFQCTFCGIKALGRAVRHRSIANVMQEIDFLQRTYGAREIMFVDAIFPVNRKLGVEFCEEFIRTGMNKKIKWVTEARVDVVDYELLKLMYDAGCRVIEYGIESGSEKVLRSIKKDITLDRIRQAVAASKRAGLDVCASFIIGLPGETKADIRQTVDFIKSLDIDYPKINLLVPYPGSAIYELIAKNRIKISAAWDEYTSFSSMTENEPVFVPEGMTGRELKYLHKEAYRQIYMRPKFILNHIRKLNSIMNIKKYITTLSVLLKGMR